jgi:hypothetical protein
MSGMRWGKWVWSDWLSDPALSSCSLAAQGLWMRMLCIMARSDPVGHLALPLDRARLSEAKQVSRMCSAHGRHVDVLLQELETRGVFSRQDGVIISRRMVRDHAKSEAGRTHIAKRWGGTSGTTPNSEPNRSPNRSNGADLLAESESESESESPTPTPTPASGGGASKGFSNRQERRTPTHAELVAAAEAAAATAATPAEPQEAARGTPFRLIVGRTG